MATPGDIYNSFSLLKDSHSLGYTLTLQPAKDNVTRLGHIEENFLILEDSVSLKSAVRLRLMPFNLVSLSQSSGMDVNVPTPNSLSVIYSIFTDLRILSLGISVIFPSPVMDKIKLIILGASNIGNPTIIILAV